MFQLSLITPNGKMFDGQIESLSTQGSEGSFGVLTNHAPMVTSLKKGVLKIKDQSQEKYFALSSGILEVGLKNQVLILADEAIPANNLEDADIKIKNLSSK